MNIVYAIIFIGLLYFGGIMFSGSVAVFLLGGLCGFLAYKVYMGRKTGRKGKETLYTIIVGGIVLFTYAATSAWRREETLAILAFGALVGAGLGRIACKEPPTA
ncbi:MAG: hypothetical protein V1875_09280 [Candidatus Altiarchaeota archaeon]